MPVYKQREESPQRYHESDTVWINPAKSTSHLYLNKICPQEFSELDSHASSYGNLNHCTPPNGASQEQYYASTNLIPQGMMLHTSNKQGIEAAGQKVTTVDTVSSCSSQSRQSESYKLTGSDCSQGSGLGRYITDDLIRHAVAENLRATNPGFPSPAPPLMGPSSSFKSFGHQSSGKIYGYRSGPYFFSPSCGNHYETASIYQDTDLALCSEEKANTGP